MRKGAYFEYIKPPKLSSARRERNNTPIHVTVGKGPTGLTLGEGTNDNNRTINPPTRGPGIAPDTSIVLISA